MVKFNPFSTNFYSFHISVFHAVSSAITYMFIVFIYERLILVNLIICHKLQLDF